MAQITLIAKLFVAIAQLNERNMRLAQWFDLSYPGVHLRMCAEHFLAEAKIFWYDLPYIIPNFINSSFSVYVSIAMRACVRVPLR